MPIKQDENHTRQKTSRLIRTCDDDDDDDDHYIFSPASPLPTLSPVSIIGSTNDDVVSAIANCAMIPIPARNAAAEPDAFLIHPSAMELSSSSSPPPRLLFEEEEADHEPTPDACRRCSCSSSRGPGAKASQVGDEANRASNAVAVDVGAMS